MDPNEKYPHNYTTVYADEGWYKNSTVTEQTLIGVVRTVPPEEGASTLMRTYYYTLETNSGNYSVKAQKGDLDPYLNRTNEWVGKVFTFSLEGTGIIEFWPGKVRSEMDF